MARELDGFQLIAQSYASDSFERCSKIPPLDLHPSTVAHQRANDFYRLFRFAA